MNHLKRVYTIGETAKLFGISTQTLRYYDKIDLIKPACIDEETGYRYYSFEQFHYIDRIKYLQDFGLKLSEIKKIISSGDVEELVFLLEDQHRRIHSELNRLQDLIHDIKWYKEYFQYFDEGSDMEPVYRVHMEERYILKVPSYDEKLPDIEIRMAARKAELKHLNLKYRRQYGYILDYDAFIEGRFRPLSYFIFLKEPVNKEDTHFMTLAEGDYLCTSLRILTDEWDPSPVRDYFIDLPKPRLAIALEYEDNLVQYKDTKYEIQILK